MNPILQELLTWTSTGLYVTQSAFFSGLNLAIFSVSKLRLEVEAASGNLDAIRVLDLRKDSNFTLCTIVWGNAVTNVLLTLLSDSVLAGLGAFVFSTFAITVFGDIVPQAYFSRNALQMAARLRPLDLEVYCHRPVIVSDMSARLGDVIGRMKFRPKHDVIENDLILMWGKQKRIITGSDLLGRPLRGIAIKEVKSN